MATTIIKSYNSDNQAIVNAQGELLVSADISGGSLTVSALNSYGTANPFTLSVGTTSTILLAANASRRYMHIVNNDAYPIYIQFGAAAVFGRGIKINPGAFFQMDATGLYLGTIFVISSHTGVVIDVLEGTP